MNENANKNYAVLTPERHVQHRGWAAGWNTCPPSDWGFHSCPHQKHHHSPALHYSEGTGWCSALDRWRDSLTHTDVHELHTYRQVSKWSLMRLAGSFAGEALSAVIRHQTLCGCCRTCQLIPQCVETLCATKLWGLLQVSEPELNKQVKLTQSAHSGVHIDPYKSTYTLHYVHSVEKNIQIH